MRPWMSVDSAACFLASDQAGYITGTSINVDGGASPVVCRSFLRGLEHDLEPWAERILYSGEPITPAFEAPMSAAFGAPEYTAHSLCVGTGEPTDCGVPPTVADASF